MKPGSAQLKTDDKFSLWLPAICKKDFQLETDKEYHVQGRDGKKFVLDHNSHVEPWPETTVDDCEDIQKQDCIKKPCKSKKGKARKTCEKRRRKRCLEKCKKYVDFENYVTTLKDGGACESNDLCN